MYIDQPVQTGFSYDTLTEGQLDITRGFIFPNGGSVTPEPDAVLEDGTFGSQNPAQTLNTTQNAARVMWTFMQAWLNDGAFKAYSRPSIHLWSQS